VWREIWIDRFWLDLDCSCPSAPGEGPWFSYHDLSLTISPEVNAHANNIIDSRVGGLIEQSSNESSQRKKDQSSLDASMNGGAGQDSQGPFPSEHEETEDEVDDLEDGDRFHGSIEILR